MFKVLDFNPRFFIDFLASRSFSLPVTRQPWWREPVELGRRWWDPVASCIGRCVPARKLLAIFAFLRHLPSSWAGVTGGAPSVCQGFLTPYFLCSIATVSFTVSLVTLGDIYLIMDLEIEVPKSPRVCNSETEAPAHTARAGCLGRQNPLRIS